MSIKVLDDTIFTVIENEISGIGENKEVMLAVHQAFYNYMVPYIPKKEGMLESRVSILPEYVHFLSPYAHYQYEGVVYGPNIPIFENGVITGWWSLPDRKKQPTGKSLSYSTEFHPLGTHHWDKAMMRDRGDEFKEQVADIIRNHLRQGGH